MITRIPGSPQDGWRFAGGVVYTGIEEVVAIVGVVATVASTVAASQAASSAADYNAQLASQNAVQAQAQAQQDAMLQASQSKQQLGAVAAAYGASGVTSEGSPLDVLSSSASNAELARQTILYKGNLKAAGYLDEAALDNATASNDQTGGYLTAIGAIAKGGASVYSQYNSPNLSGANSSFASNGTPSFGNGSP